MDGDASPARMVGPLVIGSLLSLPLLGIEFCQAAHYYRHYLHKDRWIFLVIVALLLLFNTAQAGASCGFIWMQAIEPASLVQSGIKQYVPPVLQSAIVTAYMPTGLAQLFFCYRLHLWSGMRLLPTVIASVVVAEMVYCTVILAKSSSLDLLDGTPLHGLPALTSWYEIYWGFCAATDIVLAALLTFYLRRKDEGFNKVTSSIISQITRLTLGTSAITAVLQIATIVSIARTQNTTFNLPLAFEALIPYTYTICLLSAQNSRETIREKAFTFRRRNSVGQSLQQTKSIVQPALPGAALHLDLEKAKEVSASNVDDDEMFKASSQMAA